MWKNELLGTEHLKIMGEFDSRTITGVISLILHPLFRLYACYFVRLFTYGMTFV